MSICWEGICIWGNSHRNKKTIDTRLILLLLSLKSEYENEYKQEVGYCALVGNVRAICLNHFATTFSAGLPFGVNDRSSGPPSSSVLGHFHQYIPASQSGFFLSAFKKA
ncbi:MAG: hypothetical protein ALAOOOJD_01057 [bacterium]|nr:hypothetical protein [bacterium]